MADGVRVEALTEAEAERVADFERVYFSNEVRELAKVMGNPSDEYIVRRQLAIAVVNGVRS